MIWTYGEVVEPVGLHCGCALRVVGLMRVAGRRYVELEVLGVVNEGKRSRLC